MRARIDGFFQAIAGGDAAAFEAMARESFTREAYERRTAEERRRFVEGLRDEFGPLQLKRVLRSPEGVVLVVGGAKSTEEARITLDVEPSPPHRIRGVQMTVGGSAGGGGVPAPVHARMSPEELGRALDAHLARQATEDAFAGAVLVAKDGDILFEKAYGLADRALRVPNTPATRFNLGSINKIFTRVAIGQLVEGGKLALSDTLGKIIPDYPNEPARAATVAQLLEHTAGLGDFFSPEFDRAAKSTFRSNADYVAFVSRQPLAFAPGSRREYCNACYIVLGGIVEKVSGMPYEDYIARHVFGPAKMTGAGFFENDAIVPDIAMGYTRRGGAPAELRANVHTRGAAGSAAGGGYARVSDLFAFDRAIRAGQLLGEKMTAWFFGGEGGGATRTIGIGGGAPGINAVLESDGVWTVVVAANLDPPAASRIGQGIVQALTKSPNQSALRMAIGSTREARRAGR